MEQLPGLMLVGMIAIPLIAGLAIAFAPERRAYAIAMIGSLLACVICIATAFTFDWSNASAFQLDAQFEWARPIGLKFALAVDAVSLFLVALTVLLGPICVAAS